ncbi:4-carboxymuconolactone decarboxylase [Pyrrhoderma noxium]|uniref:4-carboxymuconolactone decarboxylase n=1 Tax=Pyrrhoderma noxium TaxID=2282107 RepID=A0A286UGI2_9AGAM|nr:4-carboxymuconolactone decarboxylase [Pyrrhoderma noxium]
MQTTEDLHKLLYTEGEKQRRKVLGDVHVDKSTKKDVSDFARAGVELVTEVAWGTIWTRPGLEAKQRSLVVMSVLSALGKQTELASHVKGALNNGWTEDELKEIFMQIMLQCGMPKGMECFRTADAAIKEWRIEHGKE